MKLLLACFMYLFPFLQNNNKFAYLGPSSKLKIYCYTHHGLYTTDLWCLAERHPIIHVAKIITNHKALLLLFSLFFAFRNEFNFYTISVSV